MKDLTPLATPCLTDSQQSKEFGYLYTGLHEYQYFHDHTGGNEGPKLDADSIAWPLLAPNDTVTTPSYSWSGMAKTGLYRIGLNNFGVTINGTKLLDLSSALVGVTGAMTISSTLDVTGLLTGTTLTLSSQNALTFTHATAEIIPGATSLTFRNNADNASNIVIADSGAITFRAGLSGITTLSLSGVLTSTNATDATSADGSTTGAIRTLGGVSLAKALWVGGLANIAGAVTMQSTLAVTGTSTMATINASGDLTITKASPRVSVVASTDSSSSLLLNAGSTSDGVVLFEDNSSPSWYVGYDASDSNKFIIGRGGTVGITPSISITTGDAVSMPGSLAVTGAVTGGTYNSQTISSTASFTGSVSIAAGVLTISSGSASAPAIVPTGDTNTGPFALAADQWAVAAGGTKITSCTLTSSVADDGKYVLSDNNITNGIVIAFPSSNSLPAIFYILGTGDNPQLNFDPGSAWSVTDVDGKHVIFRDAGNGSKPTIYNRSGSASIYRLFHIGS